MLVGLRGLVLRLMGVIRRSERWGWGVIGREEAVDVRLWVCTVRFGCQLEHPEAVVFWAVVR